MWFAALGTYNTAPWFVHLADKLLEGSPAVLSLLDEQRWPWRDAHSHLVAPTRLRAYLYHYDLTRRSDLPWNAAQAAADHTHWSVSAPGDVWRRVRVGDYLPVVGRGDDSVAHFLQHHGWPRRPAAARQAADVEMSGRRHCAAGLWAQCLMLSLLRLLRHHDGVVVASFAVTAIVALTTHVWVALRRRATGTVAAARALKEKRD
jgi:hypothetical protein